MYYIILLRNLTRIRELLLIVYGDLLFIIPILSILALLTYQTLLASLLGIMRGIDSYSIVSNLIQLFSISTRIRERLGNIIVKDIKGMPPLRPELLESLKLVIENYPQDRKTHLNVTTALSIYITIIRTKGIRPYIVYLIIGLQDPLIRFLVF